MFQFLGSKTNFRVLELILYESLETKTVFDCSLKFSDQFMASWFVKAQVWDGFLKKKRIRSFLQNLRWFFQASRLIDLNV